METALNNPIFLVGAPRSGTTLLATMLAGHSRVACGPETQFFNKLSSKQLAEAVNDKRWPMKALSLVRSLSLAGQRVHELFGVTELELATYLLKQPPSVRAMLESLTQVHAKHLGKPRWAEKTPNHLLHLPRIRREYPDAPIIRIVRDPRDSALSMTKLPWASRSVLANCFLWDEWFHKSRDFFESDPNTLTVFYEVLVVRPEKELQRICEFVGEPFEPEMLATERNSHSVSSPNETWKRSNSEALYTDRLYVWKRELPKHLQDAATFSCLAGVRAFNYECPHEPTGEVAYYPLTKASIESHEAMIVRAAAQGVKVTSAAVPFRAGAVPFFPGIVSASRVGLTRSVRSAGASARRAQLSLASTFRRATSRASDEPSHW